MTDIVSVMRILLYTGTREGVQQELARRAVKGTKQLRDVRIDEATIGDYPFQDMTTFTNSSETSS